MMSYWVKKANCIEDEVLIYNSVRILVYWIVSSPCKNKFMNWPVITNLLALTAALILVFVLQILPAKTKDRNRYLIVLLCLLIAHLCCGYLVAVRILVLPLYAVFSLSIALLYGPAFYFYIRKFYVRSANTFIIHIIVIEVVLWIIILFQMYGLIEVPTWFYNVFYIGILLGYFYAIYKIRKTHPLKKGDAWMKIIAMGFLGLILLYGAQSLWMTLAFDNVEQIVFISSVVYSCYCLLFVLVTLRQIIVAPAPFSNMSIRIPYRKSSLDDYSSELPLLLEYVLDKQAFRKPDLTREVISHHTGLGVHRISEIINAAYKKNFNDWINDSRIEEAKKLLKSSELSIKEIYYDIGFNSKSAFNAAFKRRCGKTPTEYRKHEI